MRASCPSTVRASHPKWSSQHGLSLIEVLVAILILTTGAIVMMSAFTMGVTTNKKHGEYGTRTTVYAVSKLEELMALDFTDASTDTTVFPPAVAGGTGLADGGDVDPANPLAGYVDYLDQNGTRVDAANSAYRRQWQIATNPSGASKTITVIAISNATGLPGPPPATTLVSIKADY